jgi:HAD superfamily hydrolase (TIGR01509 family)
MKGSLRLLPKGAPLRKKAEYEPMIKTVIFDFGGVLAEEGFREGLLAIARKNGLDPEAFFADVDSLIEKTGYLTGMSDEASFWNAVRAETGIGGDDGALRREILSRFVLRPEMVAEVDALRAGGLSVSMLSDQTNWLDELDGETALSRHFDRVFNSYRTHKSKRDASVFRDVCAELGADPGETLFIDDNVNHIRRAGDQGLKTIHFTGIDDFKKQLRERL